MAKNLGPVSSKDKKVDLIKKFGFTDDQIASLLENKTKKVSTVKKTSIKTAKSLPSFLVTKHIEGGSTPLKKSTFNKELYIYAGENNKNYVMNKNGAVGGTENDIGEIVRLTAEDIEFLKENDVEYSDEFIVEDLSVNEAIDKQDSNDEINSTSEKDVIKES